MLTGQGKIIFVIIEVLNLVFSRIAEYYIRQFIYIYSQIDNIIIFITHTLSFVKLSKKSLYCSWKVKKIN